MPECNIKDTSIDESGDFQDSVVYQYQADLGQVVENPVAALAMARTLGPNPVPQRRTQLAGSYLFVDKIAGKRESVNRKVWVFDVTFATPPSGTEDDSQTIQNPLDRPAVYNVDYADREYVVKQARNVVAMNCASGAVRPANTLGVIHNTAFKRPDEPIVDTESLGVIVIEKNFANLGDILDLNEDFQRTTNSDEITIGNRTFTARKLKYRITRSQGRQVENGVTFYPGVTEIAIERTTDLVLDNTGFDYWEGDNVTGKYVRAKDGDGNDTAEPVNLKLDGTKDDFQVVGWDGVKQLRFRHLEEVAYAGFFA